MSVNSKHIATFLLGAAAALAANKYMNMTAEEKEKLAGTLKDKANELKTEAENFADKAKDYFEELKTKGTAALKDHMADAEKMMSELFEKKVDTTTPPTV